MPGPATPPARPPAPRPVPGFRRSVAIVIGINDYHGGIARLDAAAPDALMLAKHLRRVHGFEVALLTDARATKQGIEAALRDPCAHLIPPLDGALNGDDRLLLYFAGHGVAMDADSGPRGYLMPSDASHDREDTFLEMSSVVSTLEGLKCRHVLVILDCCFAGAFRWALGRDAVKKPKSLFRIQLDRYVRDRAWQVLVSTAHDALAMDVLAGRPIGLRPASQAGDDGASHSPFALALLDALSGSGDLTNDGIITASEIHVRVRSLMSAMAGAALTAQTPTLFSWGHGRGEYVFFARPGADEALPAAPPLSLKDDPYRGLSAYRNTSADVDVFFGRAAAARDLIKHVHVRDLTAVVGPSGSGKSSLVQAGLLPRVTADGVPIVGPLRPGDAPFVSLARALQAAGAFAGVSVPTADEERERANQLREDSAALSKKLGALRDRGRNGQIVLVIDQLEELVTMGRGGDAGGKLGPSTAPDALDLTDRELFLSSLSRAIQGGSGWLRVVVTLRSDFESQIAPGPKEEFPWIPLDLWRTGRFVVPAFTPDELRQVIEGPAAKKTLFFEPDTLVDQMVQDVAGVPGALPLLSFALSELFRLYIERGADQRALLESDYDRMGGVEGALQHHAERMYALLEPAPSAGPANGANSARGDEPTRASHLGAPTSAYEALREAGGARETLRRILTRMISGSGSRRARRHVATAELLSSNEREQRRIDLLKSVLVEERLIVSDEEGVEPAHDTLVFGWKRITEWREAASSMLLVHRKLTEAAFDWRDRKKDLWDLDSRLPQVLEMRRRDPLVLCVAEEAFVAKSVERRRLVRGGVLAAAILLLGLFATLAFWSYRDARASRASEGAAKSLLRLTVNPAQGLTLAREAYSVYPSPDTEWALRRALLENRLRDACRIGGERLPSMERSEDGHRILFVSEHEISLLETAPLRRTLHKKYLQNRPVIRATLVRDGGVLVLAGRENEARVELWGLEGERSKPFPCAACAYVFRGPEAAPLAAIVSAGGDTVIRDVSTNEDRTTLPGKFLTVDPTGKYVMTGDVARIFRLLPKSGSRAVECSPAAETKAAKPIWLSPAGDGYVSGDRPGSSGSTLVLNDACGRKLADLRGSNSDRAAVVFSSDGKRLAAFLHEGESVLATPRLWTPVGVPQKHFEGHRGPVEAAGYSKNGSLLATGSLDGTARLWDTRAGGSPVVLPHGPGRSVSWLSFSPDERDVVTVDSAGVIRNWSTGWPESIAVAPTDDAAALTWGLRGGVWVRAQKGGADLMNVSGSVAARLTAPSGTFISAASVSLDGKAVGYVAGELPFVVKANSGEILGSLPDPLKLLDYRQGIEIEVAPEGKAAVLAHYPEERSAVLWYVDEPRKPHRLGNKEALRTGGQKHFVAGFSPRGDRVAIGPFAHPEGDVVTVFDVDTGQELYSLPPQGSVSAVAFDSDAKVLLIGALGDEDILLWNVKTQTIDKRISAGPVSFLQVSADNKWLISGGPGFVSVFLLSSGQHLLTLPVPTGQLRGVDIESDGRHLVVLIDQSLWRFELDGICPSAELPALAAERARANETPRSCDEIPSSATGRSGAGPTSK